MQNADHWQPTISLENLRLRAQMLKQIREFFQTRGVLEVETPILSHASVTDVYIESFHSMHTVPGSSSTEKVYLQTSPEYAMKRLLAFGSGPIYQICKAFRQDQVTSRHNPEFSMLEWYRPDFDHHALMDEMDEFLQDILSLQQAQRFSYAELFRQYLNIDSQRASFSELSALVLQHINADENILIDADNCLQLLMSHIIEPQLGFTSPVFVYDFPVAQAALAKIRYEKNYAVASRFEVYVQGMELANGFHELQDAVEQEQRFKHNLIQREMYAYPTVPIDDRFLAALHYGLPDCAGVALGIDRLMMILLKTQSITDTLSFAFPRA